MKYLGDIAEDQITYFRFSTHKADGTPITLAGTPAISVYKNDDDTQSTAGVTLSVDDDSVTGMHTVKLDTSADAFYAVGADYSVVITAGTVDSVSVVGTVLATFSIENRTSFPKADFPTNFSALGIESDGHAHADLKQWLGGDPAALTDTDKLQCSVQHIAASYDYTAAHVWYVSKAGNDSNAGHSWTAAKLTVAAAIAAATSGDTILVSGVYDESLDAHTKTGLHILGLGIGSQLTCSTGYTLYIGNYTTVENLTVSNTLAQAAIICSNSVGCRLLDCYISGTFDGVAATGTSGLRIDNCRIHGNYDALNLTNAVDWIINNSVLSTDCTWSSPNTYFRAAVISGGRGQANGCVFSAIRNDTSSGDTSAICVFAGNYSFNNCLFVAKQLNAGGTGAVGGITGVDGSYIGGTTGDISIVGGSVQTSQSGSGAEYSLWHTSGVLSADSLQYDESKTSGTITKTGFDPASDTVILAATQGSYAPAKAGDAMTLTAAYDAAKTAASATALSAVQTHGDTTWATATTVGLSDIDGIDWEVAMASMLAHAVGVSEVTDSVVEFKRRDGLTTVATVTMGNTAGTRTTSVLVGE